MTKKDSNPTMPGPEELDGQTLDEMAETIDEAITEELETIDDTGPDETRADAPQISVAVQYSPETILLGQVIGLGFAALVDKINKTLGVPLLTPEEKAPMIAAGPPVANRYLPDLETDHPELMALALSGLAPLAIRAPLMFQKPKPQHAQPVEDVTLEPETDAAPDR